MLVGDDEHAFQLADHLITAPILRQIHRGAFQVASALGQLFLKTLAKGKGVRHRTGKTGDDLAVVKPAHLFG